MNRKTDTTPPLSENLPPELDAEIRQVLAEKQFSNLEELNQAVATIIERHNHKTLQELGGLSPEQVSKLIYSDWNSPKSAIHLNPSLTFEDLKHVRLLTNTRLLLIKVSAGIKATATGNLNRGFVEEMLDQMVLPEGYANEVRRYNKVINEKDLSPLHILRIFLELSGLLRKTKGIFRTTKKGTLHLSEEQSGSLYTLLFFTVFRKFNLAYFDRLPDLPGILQTIAYSLYQLSRQVSKWRKPEDLAHEVFLLEIHHQLLEYGYPNYPQYAYSCRIERPLIEFELLETRQLPCDKKWLRRYEVRKTELFDRFLRIDL